MNEDCHCMHNVQFPLTTVLNGGCPASIPVSSCASLLNELPYEEDTKCILDLVQIDIVQEVGHISTGFADFSALQESIKYLWLHYSTSASFAKVTPGMDLIFHPVDDDEGNKFIYRNISVFVFSINIFQTMTWAVTVWLTARILKLQNL